MADPLNQSGVGASRDGTSPDTRLPLSDEAREIVNKLADLFIEKIADTAKCKGSVSAEIERQNRPELGNSR